MASAVASAVGSDRYGAWADLTVRGVVQRMRLIQAGRFRMGSENGDRDERPVRKVELTRPFWLGDSEVTQALWRAVMGKNPSAFNDDPKRPVELVSWEAVQQFLTRLNGLAAGGGFRLPTDAEWEYACRAGSTDHYAGNLDAMAWYQENSGGRTQPVKRKQPNAWSLYDMHGNVWEWCADWYADSYRGASLRDPTGPTRGSRRVVRGGGWSSAARNCRAARRDVDEPARRGYYLGFRLARDP